MESTAFKEFKQGRVNHRPPRSYLAVLVLMTFGIAALWIIAAPWPSARLAILGLPAIALLAWGAHKSIVDPSWLVAPLVLEETLPYLNFLPFEPSSRWWIRYPILLALCLPALPAVWHSKLLQQGYLKSFLLYFGWAAVSIDYSLYPAISAGRLFPVVLLFLALSVIATTVRNENDVQKVLGRFLVGCGILVGLMVIAAIAFPQSIFVEGDDPAIGVYNWYLDQSGILRFEGFFATPNEIGAVMLATMAAGLLHWKATSGWRRYLLAATMATSLVLAVMADSRSPFVALTVGVAAFLIWRYGARGVIACLGIVMLAYTVVTVLSWARVGNIDVTYFNRNLDTFTGRSEAWDFELRKVMNRPLTGYGYDVEGAIMEDRAFPLWERFWANGPNTSLHNGYMSVAVGLGIPALLFWIGLFIGPWVSLFRRRDDSWKLKPLFFLIVIPMLILGLDESGVAEPRYVKGLLLFACWMLAERQRIAVGTAEEANRHTIRSGGQIDFQRLLTGAKVWGFVFIAGGLMTMARPALAENYYVDSVSGNDASRGTDPSSAWRTLDRVNHFPFHSNDVIYLKRGSVFRETLRPEGADDENFHGVSFIAYGNGSLPTINGSDIIRGWSRSDDQVFRTAEPSRVYNVFVDGGPGWGVNHACCLPDERCAPSPRAPAVRGDTCVLGPMRPGSWFWSGQRRGPANLYVWLPDGADPAAHTIEAVTREFGVLGYARGNQLDGITFEGIAIVQTGLRGISLQREGAAGSGDDRSSVPGIRSLVIRNCMVARTGTGRFDDGSYGNAITLINAAAPLIEHNIVSYAGNHGNGINVQDSNGAHIIGNSVDHWNHNGIDIKGSCDVLVEGNVARDQSEIGAGFYTEYSSNVTFRTDRSSNVSTGFQISENASASLVDCKIEHAGTCVYFGPRAISAILQHNSAQSCDAVLQGQELANVLQQDNNWHAPR